MVWLLTLPSSTLTLAMMSSGSPIRPNAGTFRSSGKKAQYQDYIYDNLHDDILMLKLTVDMYPAPSALCGLCGQSLVCALAQRFLDRLMHQFNKFL